MSINDLSSDKISDKILDEKETRKKMISFARQMGSEKELLLLFAKYDNLLRNCSNEKERRDIGKLGALEIFKLLGGRGELTVNGQLVYKE